MVLLIMATLLTAAGTGGDGGAQQAAELARKTLAAELGVAAEAVRVTAVTAVEWPDSSLGCPRKGSQYLPVVTPGHRVVLEAEGRAYTVHVAGARAVTCRGSSSQPRMVAAVRLADLARRDLAARLKIDPEEVKTSLLRPRSWPDASLGCPKPEASYAQVVTPGFLIELEAAGKTYRYHSDLSRVVFCDEG